MTPPTHPVPARPSVRVRPVVDGVDGSTFVKKVNPRARKFRMALATIFLMVAAAFAAPFSGLLLPSPFAAETAAAQSGSGVGGVGGSANPRSDYWREVREGPGSGAYSAVAGWDNPEAAVLIQNGGQNWRRLRNGVVATYAPWTIVAVFAALVLYHLFHGQNKLADRPSGRRVLRWKPYERALHWTMALLFVVLAVTGLSLFFGRAVLIPVLGKDAFAAYAGLAKDLHNYLGPAFFACMLAVLLLWLPRNIPNRHDWEWLKRGGGLFGKSGGGHGSDHPPAGFLNAGEKIWYWIVFIIGGLVCLSGLVLDFPNFGQTREAMQWANLIHAALSVGWIAVALGHIYIGTLGTEGALEGMRTGYVSEEWAKQHHNLWAAEAKPSGTPEPASPSSPAVSPSASPAPAAPAAG